MNSQQLAEERYPQSHDKRIVTFRHETYVESRREDFRSGRESMRDEIIKDIENKIKFTFDDLVADTLRQVVDKIKEL